MYRIQYLDWSSPLQHDALLGSENKVFALKDKQQPG